MVEAEPAPTAPSAQPTPRSLDELAALTDPSELGLYTGTGSAAVRRVVAERLCQIGGPKAFEPLSRLVDDRSAEIAAVAIAGLASFPEPEAYALLRRALQQRNGRDGEALVKRLRDAVGGAGLLALTAGLPRDPARAWWLQKTLFDEIDGLADPRAADALVAYLGRQQHPHYRFRAARALASLGDPRAVEVLAWRLRQDPLKLYRDDVDWEIALQRDDNERVQSARLLADLARLHPELREQLARSSEDALSFWIHELPSPHGNGLRALAELGSPMALRAVREWANPNAPLPLPGQQPPMPEEWVIAQSSLRYLGKYRDAASFPIFEKMLKLRPDGVDVTMSGLMAGGVAILGMSLRAVGIGASEGLSEWGDERAFAPLVAFIHDTKNNEQAISAACFALPWVGGPRAGTRILELLKRYRKKTPSDSFRRECLLRALAEHPMGANPSAVLRLLSANTPKQEQLLAARALGRLSLPPAVQDELVRIGDGEPPRSDAATLALLLAGKPERAMGALSGMVEEGRALSFMAEYWYDSFNPLFEADLVDGRLFRAIDSAEAIAASGAEVLRAVPKEQAISRLGGVVYDNGPHSATRVVLRHRLLEMASQPGDRQARAMVALRYFREEGCLMALAEAPGVDHELAKRLLRELRTARTSQEEQ